MSALTQIYLQIFSIKYFKDTYSFYKVYLTTFAVSTDPLRALPCLGYWCTAQSQKIACLKSHPYHP
ncbi:protein of unknown function [Candidatus Filomicrobium marinum]|uniref:Uncharacterized protein n=1 Tax=Candidatus Filomicrobium marinum TaxID=1608628 RepID=A0A0D6JG06_9HYPH|nr:protein of unknown function [Candidatus Filomicrobium marinum]CPR19860.1 protein of unknown function [Candidatus Filomicrobium marinum]